MDDLRDYEDYMRREEEEEIDLEFTFPEPEVVYQLHCLEESKFKELEQLAALGQYFLDHYING